MYFLKASSMIDFLKNSPKQLPSGLKLEQLRYFEKNQMIFETFLVIFKHSAQL